MIERVKIIGIISAVLLAGCATVQPPDLYPDTVPRYTRPDLAEPSPSPASDVDAPTPIGPGDIATGGGVIIDTATSIRLHQLVADALPACEASAAAISQAMEGERAYCRQVVALRDYEIDYWRRDARVMRAAVVVVAVVGAAAVAAAFAGGMHIGGAL